MMIDKSFDEIQDDITALAFEEAFGLLGEVVSSLEAVSYTHLTLPTICSV